MSKKRDEHEPVGLFPFQLHTSDLELRALAALIEGAEPDEESFRFRREHNAELRRRLISPTGRFVEPPLRRG